MRRFASGLAAGLAAGVAALIGCTVGPEFHSPKSDLPYAYEVGARDVASTTYGGQIDTVWWQSFGDSELDSLVERLAKENLQLQGAAERIRQARAQRVIAASQGKPHVEGDARYFRERESYNGLTSLVEPAPGAPIEFNLYQPQVQMSWELDLFGKVRRSVEAADARTDLAVEALQEVALSAIAELAQDYLTLRELQAEERVLLGNLEAARRRVELTKSRFFNGVATRLEVAQAEAQQTEVAQSLPSLHNQQSAMMNAIAQLLDDPPRALSSELEAPRGQPSVPPRVPIGLPGELVRRRPDVRQAESRLHAATADTGVAVADFFPTVSLGGYAGFESLHAGSLFDWASRAFMIGPTVTIPFYQGGRLKGTLELRRSQEREAAISYRETVLQAWHDVDNGLTAYAEAQHARDAASATVEADRHALSAAEDQFAQGVATQLDVVSALGSLYRGEDAQVRAEAQVENSLVTLYKSLGGGWENGSIHAKPEQAR